MRTSVESGSGAAEPAVIYLGSMDHLLGEGTWVGLLGSEASLCKERAAQSKLAMPFGWRRCWRQYVVTED